MTFRATATVVRVGEDGAVTRHSIRSYQEVARLVTDRAIDVVAGFGADRPWYAIVDDEGLVCEPPLATNAGVSMLLGRVIAGPVAIVGEETGDGDGYEPLPSFFLSADFGELMAQASTSPELAHELARARESMMLEPVVVALDADDPPAPRETGLR